MWVQGIMNGVKVWALMTLFVAMSAGLTLLMWC